MQNIHKITLSFLLIIFFLSGNIVGQNTSKKKMTIITFGSCTHEYEKEQMWSEVLKQKPKLWIWLGDIVYGDTNNMDTLRYKYDLQKSHQDYQKLKQKTKIIGTWDDHDYGTNDGGRFYPKRKESKKELIRFLDLPQTDKINTHSGVYNSYIFGKKNKKVKVILLDTRYFRDTLYPAKDGISRYQPNKEGDILGEKQWKWLEQELQNSDAQFHIIASSIQVISAEHPYEKWSNFPKAHKRLYDLLQKIKPKRTLILSGDRHIAELSKIKLPDLPYTLYDFTSSGLTHTWRGVGEEANPNREGKLIINKNFGLIEIDWKKMTLKLRSLGKSDKVFFEKVLRF